MGQFLPPPLSNTLLFAPPRTWTNYWMRIHGSCDASWCLLAPAHTLGQGLLVGGGHAAHHQQLLHAGLLPRQRLPAGRQGQAGEEAWHI